MAKPCRKSSARATRASVSSASSCKRLPLTYRSAANETGADSELSVRVDDVEWAERPTLFGAAPAERVYTLSTDEQGKTSVVFGDGVRGARLPSGVNNVRATLSPGHRARRATSAPTSSRN